MVRQAIILVGGRGSRLGEATRFVPKPLMPIADDHRFLDYLLAHVVRQGITDIVLLAGHLGDQVAERYHGASIGGARADVIRERLPAGTAGALQYAAQRLEPIFLMFNGDSLFTADYCSLEQSLGRGDVGAIALRGVPDASRFGTVTHTDGRVVAFLEKDATVVGRAEISAGVYLLRREVLSLVRAVPWSMETQVFPELCSAGRLSCRPMEGYFIDIGLPDTLDKARKDLPQLGLV